MLSDFVKYVKQYWHDRPDKSTPLNADRLNHIENGIGSNSEAINQIANAVVSNIVNDPEKIASMAAVYALQEKLGTGELPSDAPNAISAINTLYSNLGHFQYAVIKSKQSHTFNVNATCWFVLHGNTDQNGSLFAGDVRGRLYTLCGGDSSTNVLVSYDDGKLTITNNINWAEVFIVFG